MVLDDLRALPDSPLVTAEGSALPAHAVSTGVADRSRAVWLVPTDDFQRALLAARGTPAGQTALYALLRELIAREASEHHVPMLSVDGSLDLDATVAAVEELFAEAMAEGPRAETRAERQVVAVGGKPGNRGAGSWVLREAVGRRRRGAGCSRVLLRMREHRLLCQRAPPRRRSHVWTGARPGPSLTTDQAVSMIYFVRLKLAAPARAQLPLGNHAIRTLQVPAGQGRIDALSDRCFNASISNKQHPHMHHAADAVRSAVMRRHRTGRLMIPVPAQCCGHCTAWRPQVSVHVHR
jgi:hypothetical protein